MKKDIHPEYFKEVGAKCVCGQKFIVGSTLKDIEIEVCSGCHPFYTGGTKVLDSAGRVERFKQKQAKAVEKPIKKKKTKSRNIAVKSKKRA